MGATVRLRVVKGPMLGFELDFEQHDLMLVGRAEDCHLRLQGDPFVSRHHCLLEVNPPAARVRDLGSQNGTWLNGVRHGGREPGQSPAEGARHTHPDLALHAGDVLDIGRTSIAIVTTAVAATPPGGGSTVSTAGDVCRACGAPLAADRTAETALCPVCEAEAQAELAALCGQAPGGDATADALRAALVRAGYQVSERLGSGSFGRVYRARASDGRTVAIKVMNPRVGLTDEARQTFEREVGVVRALNHPGIVSLLGHGAAGDAYYFVLEFCGGGSLATHVGRLGGPLSLAAAAPLMMQGLEALAYTHEHGLVHRDLKPANLLLTDPPARLKIADYGLAKSFIEAGFSGMTMTGSFAGTCDFMAREQLVNFKYVQPVSDVWSLAASYYWLLTGTTPRERAADDDPLRVILSASAVPIAERLPELSPAVAEVIDRALSTSVSQRYPEAGAMLTAMRAALSGGATEQRPAAPLEGAEP